MLGARPGIERVARQLRAKNFAAHYAKLQETKTLASPQLSVVSHPENNGTCFDSTAIVSEARNVARPQVSAVSHPVNSGTCLDTTSSDFCSKTVQYFAEKL